MHPTNLFLWDSIPVQAQTADQRSKNQVYLWKDIPNVGVGELRSVQGYAGGSVCGSISYNEDTLLA